MPDYTPFIRAIHKNPKDSLGYLVLADAMEESGEPEDTATAHAIRQSIEIHGNTADHVKVGKPWVSGRPAAGMTYIDNVPNRAIHIQHEDSGTVRNVYLPHPSWSQLIEKGKTDPKWLHGLVDRLHAEGHSHAADTLYRALTEDGGHVYLQTRGQFGTHEQRFVNDPLPDHARSRVGEHAPYDHSVVFTGIGEGTASVSARHPMNAADYEIFKNHPNPMYRSRAAWLERKHEHPAAILAVTHGPPRIE